MDVGMLWFDNDPKTLMAVKIARAAKYYFDKYHQVPNTCLVNPKDLPEGGTKISVISVHPLRSVLPGHLWIGVENHVEENR